MTITYPPVPSVLGVSPHGIFAALGLVAGALLLLREVRRRDFDLAVVERALTWAVPAGIVGARADYVISHPEQFHSLGQVLAVWNGGLALFGGLIVGLPVGLVVAYRAGAHLPRVLDAAAPALALAITVGRVGDLLLTDHLGAPTSSPVALAYRVRVGYDLASGFGPSPAVPPPPGVGCAEVGRFYAGCSYHLTPAYDLLGALVLFGVLMGLRRWVDYRAGTAISLWALWYGAQRLGLDFTRGIDKRPALGLTGTQLVAIGVVAAGMVSVAVILFRRRGWGEESDDPPSRVAPLRRPAWQRSMTSGGHSEGNSS
ncbi:MAG TPA: prolipoprotein diacylglyceryl transferase family protein [Pseudonocardiaceae bacterium]|nr:prolipoprotein diacylglyceryl transferase family protein [Pseudonocardiaceae bacterium]